MELPYDSRTNIVPLNQLITSHTLGIAKCVDSSDARIESSDAWEYSLPS